MYSIIDLFSDYEDAVSEFACYPSIGNNLVYPALGLCGEAGEFAEKVKKLIRDKGGNWKTLSPEEHLNMLKELGDVLWYVTAAAKELESSLQEVAEINAHKLKNRSLKNKIHGEGDDR